MPHEHQGSLVFKLQGHQSTKSKEYNKTRIGALGQQYSSLLNPKVFADQLPHLGADCEVCYALT